MDRPSETEEAKALHATCIGLSDEEIEWIRARKNREEAMGVIARKLRDILTLIVLTAGAFTLFWDSIVHIIKATVK